MLVARINSIDYPVLIDNNFMDSSSQGILSSCLIDFSLGTKETIPTQFSEVQIIDTTGAEITLFSGFVTKVTFPTVRTGNEPLNIKLSLLNYRSFTSNRSISVDINQIALNDAIETILQPLIDDGFTIEENDLPGDAITITFDNETIEKTINELMRQFNFSLWIDKDKKIFIKDIDKLKNQENSVVIDDNNLNDLAVGFEITPTFNAVDYSNIVILKNIKSIELTTLIPTGTVLSDGETYNFAFPISINQNVASRAELEIGGFADCFILQTTDATDFFYQIQYGAGPDPILIITSNIGFAGVDDADSGKIILFNVNANDPTVITGFRYNSTTSRTVASGFLTIGSYSRTSLVGLTQKFINTNEVEKNKDLINTTGEIEKIIDINNRIFSFRETLAYAKNVIIDRDKYTEGILLNFKSKPTTAFFTFLEQFDIFKKIKVKLDDYLIDNEFIVYEKSFNYKNQLFDVTIRAKTSNLNENYSSIYRKLFKDDNRPLQTIVTSLLIDDETGEFKHEIIVDGEVVNDV